MSKHMAKGGDGGGRARPRGGRGGRTVGPGCRRCRLVLLHAGPQCVQVQVDRGDGCGGSAGGGASTVVAAGIGSGTGRGNGTAAGEGTGAYAATGGVA